LSPVHQTKDLKLTIGEVVEPYTELKKQLDDGHDRIDCVKTKINALDKKYKAVAGESESKH
jgi:hypothetical protein